MIRKICLGCGRSIYGIYECSKRQTSKAVKVDSFWISFFGRLSNPPNDTNSSGPEISNHECLAAPTIETKKFSEGLGSAPGRKNVSRLGLQALWNVRMPENTKVEMCQG